MLSRWEMTRGQVCPWAAHIAGNDSNPPKTLASGPVIYLPLDAWVHPQGVFSALHHLNPTAFIYSLSQRDINLPLAVLSRPPQ